MKIIKNKKILCFVVLLAIFILVSINKENNVLVMNELVNNDSEYNSFLKTYIETYYQSGIYLEYDVSSVSSRLSLNTNLSYCANMNYNDDLIYVSVNSMESCYLFFNVLEDESNLLDLKLLINNEVYDAYFFSNEVYDYYLEVPDGTTSVEIRAVIRGTDTVIEGIGTFDLTSGNNTKEIKVINDDKEYTYNITIYVPINEDSLANFIINSADKEQLLQHTSSLENSANDNRYRYSGLKVNNYICFGVSECSTTYNQEYLYRIIEIDQSNGYIKVIKNSVYDILLYDNIWDNNYETSTLNTVLNTTFLDSFSEEWTNLIALYDWNVYGATWTDIYTNLANAKEVYDLESSSHYEVKVGLMNIYDYAYSTESKYWTYPVYYYGDEDYGTPCKYSWLYQGYREFTIARSETFTYSIWHIQESGNVRERYVALETNIRPVFYISSAAKYLKGDGTNNNPYIINMD